MNTSRMAPPSSRPPTPKPSASVQETVAAFLQERAEILKNAKPKPLPETWETYHDSSIDDLN